LIAISGDPWPDDVRLSDIEHRFICAVCGKRGADAAGFQLGPEARACHGLSLMSRSRVLTTADTMMAAGGG
jgi:hypothetical protein